MKSLNKTLLCASLAGLLLAGAALAPPAPPTARAKASS
ncbi:cytochrome C2 [Xanthomonas fragariae]|uniref:Cytochrome C2 n=1 Tax=Xanthomonas fragariae TaxID=48664 RepID=A0A1Y6H117_9XANT|nr:cytochrome C2 [Xanthomonas fragariae]SMQ99063.1 hypothetical protein PD885_01819 [Xanthomonas fragariae]SMR03105.1 cytochrome C2 [Xanthomonas fragariae]